MNTFLVRNYRFIPSKPLWKRFDVSLEAEFQKLNQSFDQSTTEIFSINRADLPERTQLDIGTVKLLERLSLVEFGTEVSLKILEEAIRYADPLLTKQAFYGTINNSDWTWDTTKPMISLTEEINPQFSCPLDPDNPNHDPDLALNIIDSVPNTWEGYIVAPPGNIPIEPKGILIEACKQNK